MTWSEYVKTASVRPVYRDVIASCQHSRVMAGEVASGITEVLPGLARDAGEQIGEGFSKA